MEMNYYFISLIPGLDSSVKNMRFPFFVVWKILAWFLLEIETKDHAMISSDVMMLVFVTQTILAIVSRKIKLFSIS